MFGSVAWTASTLGRRNTWFYENRAKLVEQGFPAPDPIVGLYIKADVLAWVNKRRKFADPEKTVPPDFRKPLQVNFDAL